MKNLVVLTGAGISAESGLKTFRDSNGLWEEHPVMDVASRMGWEKNPGLVLDFYNRRRQQANEAIPNHAHLTLFELEKHFHVEIITQNVDDLHERAGSTRVLHLHGELNYARSTINPNLLYNVKDKDIHIGDCCELGSQLRPHIVFFGEEVPEMENAANIVERADIFCIIGTSLIVYPAASLVDYCRKDVPIYLIDPNPTNVKSVNVIQEKATIGIDILSATLLNRKDKI